MVDFAKFRLYENNRNAIYDRLGIRTFITHEEESGNIVYPIKCDCSGFEVYHYKAESHLLVSMPKYWNLRNGGDIQNYQDLTHKELSEAIYLLSNDASLDPSKCNLLNLEFGLSLPIDECPTHFIDTKVYSHQRKFIGKHEEYNGAGCSLHFRHAEYILKLYDKGVQYGLDNFLLRFEVRINKARHLQTFGLTAFNDLCIKLCMHRLGLYLLDRFDELLILDDYHEHASPLYWKNLAEGKSYNTVLRGWKKFLSEVETRDMLQTKDQLREMIMRKWTSLLRE